jgi:hypothetical protein
MEPVNVMAKSATMAKVITKMIIRLSLFSLSSRILGPTWWALQYRQLVECLELSCM